MSEHHQQSASATLSSSSVVLATRLHLGKASAPPPIEKLQSQVQSFLILIGNNKGLIAVDATPKLDGYDFVATVQRCVDNSLSTTSTSSPAKQIEVIPVTPWGSFCPALNSLVSYAKIHKFQQIGFVSAEVQASPQTIDQLCQRVDDDTLLAGAALPGHLYSPNTTQKLGGRTCPWNTLCIWNVNKLALVGFPLVSDMPPTAGIEEVATVAILQTLLGSNRAKCKLVKVPDISWNETFDDPERQAWHEQKMASKAERAQAQLSQFDGPTGSNEKGLQEGEVLHC
jgi:hypothetical protein